MYVTVLVRFGQETSCPHLQDLLSPRHLFPLPPNKRRAPHEGRARRVQRTGGRVLTAAQAALHTDTAQRTTMHPSHIIPLRTTAVSRFTFHTYHVSVHITWPGKSRGGPTVGVPSGPLSSDASFIMSNDILRHDIMQPQSSSRASHTHIHYVHTSTKRKKRGSRLVPDSGLKHRHPRRLRWAG